jgi:hypothetical protein
MKVLLFKTFLMLLLIKSLYSCDMSNSGMGGVGGDYSPPPSDIPKDVSYSVDCEKGPWCNDPSAISTSENNNVKQYNCAWYCGNYKGNNRYEIRLYFHKRPNECWEFGAETVSKDGRCK